MTMEIRKCWRNGDLFAIRKKYLFFFWRYWGLNGWTLFPDQYCWRDETYTKRLFANLTAMFLDEKNGVVRKELTLVSKIEID